MNVLDWLILIRLIVSFITIILKSYCRREYNFQIILINHWLSTTWANDFAVHNLINLFQKADRAFFKKFYWNWLWKFRVSYLFVQYVNEHILQLLKCFTRLPYPWCVFYNLYMDMTLQIYAYEHKFQFIFFVPVPHKLRIVDFIFDSSIKHQRYSNFGRFDLF